MTEAQTSEPAVVVPLDEYGQPDLQAYIRLCGGMHAASVAERYSPRVDGGYRHLDFRAWDRAVEAWQLQRRDAFLRLPVAESPATTSMMHSVLKIPEIDNVTRLDQVTSS